MGQRIASLLSVHFPSETQVCKLLKDAEEDFFQGRAGKTETKELFSWDHVSIQEVLNNKGVQFRFEILPFTEQRIITKQEIDLWFDSTHSPYGSYINDVVGDKTLQHIKTLFYSLTKKTISWTTHSAFFVIYDLVSSCKK